MEYLLHYRWHSKALSAAHPPLLLLVFLLCRLLPGHNSRVIFSQRFPRDTPSGDDMINGGWAQKGGEEGREKNMQQVKRKTLHPRLLSYSVSHSEPRMWPNLTHTYRHTQRATPVQIGRERDEIIVKLSAEWLVCLLFMSLFDFSVQETKTPVRHEGKATCFRFLAHKNKQTSDWQLTLLAGPNEIPVWCFWQDVHRGRLLV